MGKGEQKGFSIKKSLEMFKEAKKLIPGGVQLLSRRPIRFACGVSPIFAERAKGAYFWDIDGNKYLDMTMAVNTLILGYCDPDVDEAVIKQIKKSTIFSILHPVDLDAAFVAGSTLAATKQANRQATNQQDYRSFHVSYSCNQLKSLDW